MSAWRCRVVAREQACRARHPILGSCDLSSW